MNLTIFGATGWTGQHLVEQALTRGHQLTAFARSPQKLAAYGDRIDIVEGDVQDSAAGDIKAGYVGKGVGPRITRADMASFMLDRVESDAYLHKAPAISN